MQQDGFQAWLLWGVRIAVVSGGTWLAARGVGDAALWEAAAGVVVTLAGAAWSAFSRRKALAFVPPR